MIDLHTHILPAVDDGVENDEQALAFARMAQADGTRVIVATPHCRDGFYVNDRASVLAGVERLRETLAGEGLEIELQPGAEVHLCPDLPERIRDGRAPTLADNGRTLLLELSLSQYPVGLDDVVFQLKLEGIEILFAHPERIRFFQDDPARYEAVIRLGAWGQLTTGSLLGQFGSTAKEYAEELLRKGLVHVLASDAHNTRGRPPVLSEAVESAASFVGPDRARAMVTDAPRALLAGEAPRLPPLLEGPRNSRSFLSKLFGRD